MAKPRNVLFIVIDQLRADCLTGALATHVDLPNLRQFMSEAVTFTRNFSVTNPCGPSRASLLTGQYSMNHRSVRNGAPLRHDIPSLPGELRKSGYLPLLYGYTDTSLDPRVHAADDPALTTYEYVMPGFQERLEMRSEQSIPWLSHLEAQGYIFKNHDDLYIPVAADGAHPEITDPALYAAKDSDTAFLTNAYLADRATRDTSNWFSHLTYLRPHPPLVAPAPYNTLYDPQKLPLPHRLNSQASEEAVHPFFAPMFDSATPAHFVSGMPDLKPNEDTVQALRAVYLGLASEVDHHIGRVITDLKQAGQYEDTLVIITADHGEMLGDRHAWGKMSVYNAAYHTPLIIRAPQLQAQSGMQVQLQTESVDIAPTILDWIGSDIPNSMDGQSLLPLIKGETPENWRKFTFSELNFGHPLFPTKWQKQLGLSVDECSLSILRDAQFTLVEFAGDLPPLLFDHAKKGELENVAEQANYAPNLARLTRQMLKFRMQNMDRSLALSALTAQGPQTAFRHNITKRA